MRAAVPVLDGIAAENDLYCMSRQEQLKFIERHDQASSRDRHSDSDRSSERHTNEFNDDSVYEIIPIDSDSRNVAATIFRVRRRSNGRAD